MTEASPVLYILMRNDIDSMNPGKAMAQASHAANAFVYFSSFKERDHLVEVWENSTSQGFGTVIVLACTGEQMYSKVTVAKAADLHADVVHDPTYPVRDGAVTHSVPVDTCAYIFGDKNNNVVRSIVGDLPLYP